MKRVVVTGLGALTPIGNDVAAFWDALVSGRHGFGFITHFDASNCKAKIAAEVKDFSAEKYIEKSEAKRMDLYAKYAIAAAAQAAADAGIPPHEPKSGVRGDPGIPPHEPKSGVRGDPGGIANGGDKIGIIDPERLGVYFGSGIGGMSTFLAQSQVVLEKGPGRVSPFFIPMMIANIASAYIAIRYNARGPNLPVLSACATGTHAIGEAFRAIKYGLADVIITGGAEATINPLAIGGFANAMALSLSQDLNACSIPYDKRRSGFIMGEGAGALILEEYEHAKKRGADIYCEIIGYGNTCDAFHVTAPREDASEAARMIKQCFAEAGVAPDSFGEALYINTHGTSTPLNDKCETIAIKKALGEAAAYKAACSSIKSMTGHMLGAAGAAEAIAAVLALKNGVIPPTVGLNEPDPECDLDYTPNTAAKRKIKAALSVSFGFGGHNAGVLFCNMK